MNNRRFYRAVRETKEFDKEEYGELLSDVEPDRINKIAGEWSKYLKGNVRDAIENKDEIDDYRLNPYAATTIAGILDLDSTEDISEFIFGSKLYMSLETAFGKSVENVVMPIYPVESGVQWEEHPEKIEEMEDEERGEDLVWQKVDKYCVVEDTAYLMTVKSGPRTINETVADGMKSDISDHSQTWLEGTQKHHPNVSNMEFIIGLTYGTDESTNTKDLRVLYKLVEEENFDEVDRDTHPGVIRPPDSENIRVHNKVGIDFWSYVGNPSNPSDSEHTFLEVLLGLVKASDEVGEDLEGISDKKIEGLSEALDNLYIPEGKLPGEIESEYGEDKLASLSQTLILFYDEFSGSQQNIDGNN